MKTKILSALVALLIVGSASAARADWLGSQAGTGQVPVCVGFSVGSAIAANEEHSFVVPAKFFIPTNLGSSFGFATACKFATAATGSTAILLQDNGSTVATLTVASSGTTCTFSSQSAFSVAQGHRLSIKFPASPDATLANGGVSICGAR